MQKIRLADMKKIRKACQEMDLRMGKEEPECEWFWPIYRASEVQESSVSSGANESRQRRQHLSLIVTQQDLTEESTFFYANRKEAPPETNFNEFSEEALDESLRKIVRHPCQKKLKPKSYVLET
uniref:Uncharacterized protein n=1 Tax=Ditylenchus dipsaci TaxID=166011 RepID=A0A915D158_9BILA